MADLPDIYATLDFSLLQLLGCRHHCPSGCPSSPLSPVERCGSLSCHKLITELSEAHKPGKHLGELHETIDSGT
jgi:hypothetical protein